MQTGFTPKKSTVDRILSNRVLTARLRDFRSALVAAYTDLWKASDAVNRDAVWRILVLRGMPTELVKLIFGLYSGVRAVRFDGTISDYFSVDTGVHQGCVLAATLFNTCMGHALGRMSCCGVSFQTVRITDFGFADDAVYSRKQPKFLRRPSSR